MTELETTSARDSRTRSVEALQERIAEIVACRQALRERGANASALERNRLQLARCQWELSFALIARHLPQVDADAA
jgi:hypothetical protein